MVSKIVFRFPKTIAWCLFFIFYFDMLAAAFSLRNNYNYLPGSLKNYSLLQGKKKNYFDDTDHVFTNAPNGQIKANKLNGSYPNGLATFTSSEPSNISLDESLIKSNPDTAEGPGPGQPEMQSFKSVGADNMVDMFSGDFSYNLPLLDVGGYPVSIHYNGGISMDQEATWVGLGWNINPGVINRSVRGLPDDFNGTDAITKVQNVKTNKTIGGAYSKTFEFFGKKMDKGKKVTDSSKKLPGLTVKAGAFYNNYKGWGMEYGISSSMSTSLFSKGSLTAGLSISNNSQTGLDVSPSFGVGISTKQKIDLGIFTNISPNYNSRTGISGLQMGLSGSASKQVVESVQKDANDKEISTSGTANQKGSYPLAGLSFVKPAFSPTISMPYTNESYNFSLQIGRYSKGNLKSYGTISGYTSKNYIATEDMTQTLPAYGYLNYQKAKDAGDNILMDFNRDKEVPYRPQTPHIGVPSYTYDVYSISGEGIGGSFRPYRSDIGFVFDHEMRTKSKSGNFGLDLGIGGWVQIGVDIDKTNNQTVTGPWKTGSNIVAKEIGFKNEDNTISEPVYFKNPGEKVKVDRNYFESIGDTDLVNIGLVGISSKNSPDPVLNSSLNRYKNQAFAGTVPLEADTYRKERDKRTQVISYLTADLASKFALDTLIKVYDLNAIPSLGCFTNYSTIKRNEGYRKPNHLSEISVLNNDGKRYVYGIPAYNTKQQETNFAINKDSADVNTGLVGYTPGNENSISNNTDKTDNYFNKETTPAYAHSFLLSSILSSDYVDVSGNGLSEDDQGDAIKFNYSRVYGENSELYRWRAPYVKNKASYGEGLKSDRRDDRGSYTYGEKEIWYLNSVESKNMIGVFVVETDPAKARKDMFGVTNENGGKDTAQKQYQLKEINLYTKADLIKYGAANAKPVKTVHFVYDYSLCKNHPGSESTVGKLTLRKIWFSYNKNEKGVQNPYVFRYDKDSVDTNGNIVGNNGPTYNNKSYDRWGNYKDPAVNLGPSGDKFTNADFPYATQDAITANQNSSAWSLKEILLPSGAKIKVTYESDDYGYVQNKRAMQMMEIAGFGKENTDAPQGNLFTTIVPGTIFSPACNYVFIKIPEQVNSKEELYRRYLEGVSKVFVKFNMKVPTDTWGGGSELVPCYFDIDDFGIKGSAADKIIWIKPKEVDGKNAFLLAATQFLKMNLYSKAYPVSEPGDDFTIKLFVTALLSYFSNIKNAAAGFYNYTLTAIPTRIKSVYTNKSFARLNSPGYKKYGGGHRVKKVEIFDNWNKMTGTQQRESVYGQEYDYSTTVKDEAGLDKVISSGVASYEPMIGRDENPFTVPSDPYKEQVGVFAPTDYFYVDEPVMESFYPSAMVGYSRVKVRSINRNRKSSNGFQVTEFYTTKDFPTRSSYTPLIEGESRYTYQAPAAKKLSFFNFNPKSYVSLSQGFKVELNDMNGKVKRTASYGENDSINEVSSTKNYYRLENDRLESRLSNRVQTIDSANGKIITDAEMGKEVELMVDLRQQLSVTRSSSKQLNLLIQRIAAVPPGFIPIPIAIWYRKSEINRYRSAAVTKVVNQYGILDSVVVIDKGSKVTTRNLVYDSETGEVLLTRTNNEFDDPIYNFNYPAHWAYSGMGSAYKNIQKTITGQRILNGVLTDRSKESFFESGDEIIVAQKEPKKTVDGIIITGEYTTKYAKAWALDASKGLEKNKGIYFIDGNGSPVSTPNNELSSLIIIRSGKRNMLGAGVGSITAAASPVRLIGSDYKIVFDTASHVIAASAGRYKDFWQVDSTVSPADSCFKKLDSAIITLPLNQALLLKAHMQNGWKSVSQPSKYNPTNIAAQMHHKQSGKDLNALNTKTVMDFDFKQIPLGATITYAKLNLAAMPFRDTTNFAAGLWIYNNGTGPYGIDNTKAHYVTLIESDAGYNDITLSRVISKWGPTTLYNDIISTPSNDASSIYIPGFAQGSAMCDNITNLETKNLVQSIVDNRNKSYGILMDMSNLNINGGSARQTERRSRSYYSGFNAPVTTNNACYTGPGSITSPNIVVKYNYMKDTCVLTCKPSIRPEGINPYKFGVLGNWRMDRAYSYYDSRKETDVSVETNIRKNGEISAFQTYWNFSTGFLNSSAADTAVRWVWNSEMSLFNRKGTEVENRDPLNRYNSGQYGYNKNLPIAVTQNSKSRNMAFDGFEDYDYKSSYCEAECQYATCLPTGYNAILNNCDTLANAMAGFTATYSIPGPAITYNSSGCDTSTWGFPLCPVSNSASSTTSTAYSFQSMFFNGKVGYPDSAQVSKGTNYQYQLQYKRAICITTPQVTYEANFKTIAIPGVTPLSVFFGVELRLNNTPIAMLVTIGHSGNGYITASGYTTVTRPDLVYNFTGGYSTLKIVYRADDTIEIKVNNTLLGKVGPIATGATLRKPFGIPVLQFNRLAGMVDWVKIYDGNGKVALDEQFNNGCTSFAMPKPDFDCVAKPECSQAFTNYFNNRFHTNFTYPQIGTLYKQCNILVGPCEDTMPVCNNYDTTFIRTGGFDRFADFTKGGGERVTNQKHTGKYSLKVGANKTSGNVVRIVSPTEDALVSSLSIKVDTVAYTGVSNVIAKGIGLLANYNVYRAQTPNIKRHSINGCMNANINPDAPMWNPTTEYTNIDKNWDWGSPQQFDPRQYCATDYFSIHYTGKLQPNFTAKHVFRISKEEDDNVLMSLDGTPITFKFIDGEWKTDSISLQSCRLYNIKVVYTENLNLAKCSLLWSNPFAPEPTVIPVKNFYPPTITTSDTAGSCLPVTMVPRLNTAKPTNMYNPIFSPVAGTQLLVGAWVKEEQACYTGTYINAGIDVVFAGTSTTYRLRPSGNIIEGWQRIEGIVTVPAGATSMNIGLRSLGYTDVYFDDIRVHPFNANMKSFVYNPSNLRLMSELDENNYASFYEYDNDGTLIRVKKETERGIKTIQETRSALFKE